MAIVAKIREKEREKEIKVGGCRSMKVKRASFIGFVLVSQGEATISQARA